MKRREFITLLGGAAALPLAARAQQATKMARIGVLLPGHSDNADVSSRAFNAFLPALRELGYIEGQNIAIERKFAEGDTDRLRRLATELVERRVDAIVANSTPAARAAKQATSTIPIGVGRQTPTVAQRDCPEIFSRGCSLAPPCIWRSYDGWHVEGDRERGTILRDKTSICAGG
jgi:putative ABC transport system substrate-binding protein